MHSCQAVHYGGMCWDCSRVPTVSERLKKVLKFLKALYKSEKKACLGLEKVWKNGLSLPLEKVWNVSQFKKKKKKKPPFRQAKTLMLEMGWKHSALVSDEQTMCSNHASVLG